MTDQLGRPSDPLRAARALAVFETIRGRDTDGLTLDGGSFEMLHYMGFDRRQVEIALRDLVVAGAIAVLTNGRGSIVVTALGQSISAPRLDTLAGDDGDYTDDEDALPEGALDDLFGHVANGCEWPAAPCECV